MEAFMDTLDTRDAGLAAIYQIKEKFALEIAIDDDPSDKEDDVRVGFSYATYMKVARKVGLDPGQELRDIATFDIHRSRIPTSLFKSIVTDLDMMFLQYGPPARHETEEARSRFFSPIFNHLIKQFDFALRNFPETTIKGRIGTKGRIEYFFKTYGPVIILFIEMKYDVRNDAQYLKAIAQVIAESDGCEFDNRSRNFSLPIQCVLSDGWSFEFFRFERKPTPSFMRGCFPGDPEHLRRGMKLSDLTAAQTSLPFILELRPICEVIFDLMLSAYIEGLKACRRRSEKRGKKGKKKKRRPSLDIWDRAVQLAERALATFRRAEDQRKDGDIASADATVDQAFLVLKERYNFPLSAYSASVQKQCRLYTNMTAS